VAPVAEARDRARRETDEEHRRLLYVAMTRASERLVVCGAEGERGRPQGCWWDLVADALQPVSIKEPSADGDGMLWRYQPAPRAGAPREAAIKPLQQELPLLPPSPAWLDRDAPTEAAATRALSPSRAYDEEQAPFRPMGIGSGMERKKAIVRGSLMHRLLQSLPDIPPVARTDAARRHLARSAQIFSPEEQEELLAQVQRVLADVRFARLFAAGSRAEVPIVGRLKGGSLAVSGQVDRLVVTDNAVLIADYKTNSIAREDGRKRPGAPRRFEDTPPAYVRQLALYRAVIGDLYPDRPVRAALIWTDVPDLMEIPAAILDQELKTVTSL
jgi:ATP-dependent helicase/nuclease subunit A